MVLSQYLKSLRFQIFGLGAQPVIVGPFLSPQWYSVYRFPLKNIWMLSCWGHYKCLAMLGKHCKLNSIPSQEIQFVKKLPSSSPKGLCASHPHSGACVACFTIDITVVVWSFPGMCADRCGLTPLIPTASAGQSFPVLIFYSVILSLPVHFVWLCFCS